MNKKVQISESIELGILLALSGGFMDAYSYIGRGGVFANAQTGNMLLLGVHLSEGDIPDAIRYLCPVLAFTFGIALSDIVRNLGKGGHLHWRQISVVTEAIILAIVSFFPQSHNLLANSLTSLACGIQVETFRKFMAMVLLQPCVSEIFEAVHKTFTLSSRQRNGILLKRDSSTTELFSALSAEQSLEINVLNIYMNGQSLYLLLYSYFPSS